MKTFIINLDKDKERLVNTIVCLADIGVTDPIRIPAIYGKTLSETERCAVVQNTWKSSISLSPSMIGCAMSHMKVWQTIADDDALLEENGRAFVVEDDILVHTPFHFADIELSLPAVVDADVLFLGYIRSTLDMFGLKEQYKPSSSWYRFNYPLGLSSYVISKAGARKMIQYVQDQGGFTAAIDIMMMDAMKQNVVRSFIHRPRLLGQSSNTNDQTQLTSSTIVANTYPSFVSRLSKILPEAYNEHCDINPSAFFATVKYDFGNNHQVTLFDYFLFFFVLVTNLFLPFWLYLVLILVVFLLLSEDLKRAPRLVGHSLQIITTANCLTIVLWLLWRNP